MVLSSGEGLLTDSLVKKYAEKKWFSGHQCDIKYINEERRNSFRRSGARWAGKATMREYTIAEIDGAHMIAGTRSYETHLQPDFDNRLTTLCVSCCKDLTYRKDQGLSPGPTAVFVSQSRTLAIYG